METQAEEEGDLEDKKIVMYATKQRRPEWGKDYCCTDQEDAERRSEWTSKGWKQKEEAEITYVNEAE